ncbi:MAG: Transcriptional regulator, GntR family [Myxococcales bacterium]|nr:Transcriptional regulator, GntR family [Myxococcales bacterium]
MRMVKPISFPPSARRNRGESAVEKLRREILLGRYQPGARLPPERELSLKLGTNRNTLREALRTLESENLVRARQGDGTLVLDWRTAGEINLLPHFLAEETPIEERFDALYTLFKLRDALVDHALQLAVGSVTDADVAALRGALGRLGSVESGTLDAVHADIEFYRCVVLSSRTTVLIWIFNTFARIFGQLGERYPQLWKIDRAYLDILDEVVRAIVGGDERQARVRMRELLELRSGVVLVELAPQRADALPRASLERPRARAARPRARPRKR